MLAALALALATAPPPDLAPEPTHERPGAPPAATDGAACSLCQLVVNGLRRAALEEGGRQAVLDGIQELCLLQPDFYACVGLAARAVRRLGAPEPSPGDSLAVCAEYAMC